MVLQRQSISQRCFFLAAGTKKFQRANATTIAYDATEYPSRRLVEDGMSTGLTNKHTARGSLICITCSLENNAFSVLHYVLNVALHYYMLHRFDVSNWWTNTG